MTTYTEEDLRAALAHEADAGHPVVDVWPRLHQGIVVRRRVRVGVVAATIAAVTSVLAVALPPRDNTARLPITGEGTTLVPEQQLSEAALTVSVGILRQRIDALGISGATITTHDGTIDLKAPGASNAEITAIAAPGVVQYRSVKGIQAVTACPIPSPNDTACSTDGTVAYALGLVALDNSDIKRATAARSTVDGSWLVTLDFDAAGAQKFQALAAAAAGKPDLGACGPPKGCNAIAIVVDGTVVSAPSVPRLRVIHGRQTQIGGALTRVQAETLAALAPSPPLPVPFSIR